MKYFFLIIVLLLISACAQNNDLYYYGASSDNYYRAVKLGNEKAMQNYKQSLIQVFEKSSKLHLKVPPGLYCDYALLLLKEGRNSEAKEYLLKEKNNWKESEIFIDFILQKYFMQE